MAVTDLFKSIGFKTNPGASETMALNYLKCGAEMGFAGYDEFVRRAGSFYDEAKTATEQNKEGYTRVELAGGRVAYDYQCEMRGIYSANGKPVAFFKPDYKAAGFRNALEELEDFKSR